MLALYFTGSNSMETSYSVQDELRHVLSVLSEDKAKHLDIHKTPGVFIDQRSTARYLCMYLQFSLYTCTMCTSMNKKIILKGK
jgi:hypothetical protein